MNKLDQSMEIIDAVTKKMAENREEEALIRKLENNDIYADKERDTEDNVDRDESENPAWDMREIDYL